jgi:two-component system CheB/CheR fusion protein
MKVDVPGLDKAVAEVIDTFVTKEVEGQDKDGHYWSLRIRPYKTTDNKIDGAVIALVDINEMKGALAENKEALSLADAIINTVREPLVVLDESLAVLQVNNSFLSTFKVAAGETLHRRIYDLGNGQWDIPKLRQLLEEILPQNREFHDFEVEHAFPHIGRKKMLLNARRLNLKNDGQMILLAIEDASDARKK